MVGIHRQLAKRSRMEVAPPPAGSDQTGAFEVLPQELILCILTAVLSSADKPADLINVMLVCKKFGELAMKPEVLKAASAACMAVFPGRWCPAAHRFLRRCGDGEHGNADANYFLGMVQFYCLGLQHQGWLRLMEAVRSGHALAAFAAGIISFNGTFAGPIDRDPHAAAHMFALAVSRGHLGALRDLAFCVSNGLGVPQDPAAGRRLTITVNMQELRARYPEGPHREAACAHIRDNPRCILGDLGCFTAVPTSYEWEHPANRFMGHWFSAYPMSISPARMLLTCSMPTCGRPETRGLEFRRCHICGIARYCSRHCQSLHWRMGHTLECVPAHQWLLEAFNNQAVVNVNAHAANLAAANNATAHNNLNLGAGGGGAAAGGGAGAGADAGAGAPPM